MTTEEFFKWVDTDVEVALSSEDDEQDVAIEFLDSSGIVSHIINSSCSAYASIYRSLISVVEFVSDRLGCVRT